MSSNPFRFFKCNIINGCRLSDIERFISREEVFYLNSHIACTSRSVNAAINANWIVEISEKEASQYISIPSYIEPVQQKQIKFEEKAEHSVDFQTNKAAYDRYQARLKKLETEKREKTEEPVETIQIEPGKNETANLGALHRIKNRNQKVKNAQKQEKDFIDDIVSVDREGRKTTAAISKKVEENKTIPKTEQVLIKSKNDLKAELEQKLNTKVLEKKTAKASEVKPVSRKNIEKQGKKRGQTKTHQELNLETHKSHEIFKISESVVKKIGRPKKHIDEPIIELVEPVKVETSVDVAPKRRGRPAGSKNKVVA